jgi:hypothetical protein
MGDSPKQNEYRMRCAALFLRIEQEPDACVSEFAAVPQFHQIRICHEHTKGHQGKYQVSLKAILSDKSDEMTSCTTKTLRFDRPSSGQASKRTATLHKCYYVPKQSDRRGFGCLIAFKGLL